MFTGVAITVQPADGEARVVRFRRRRGLVHATYRGHTIARYISAEVLSDHLAQASGEDRQAKRWGELEVICGSGGTWIAVFLKVDAHALSEQECQRLRGLAAWHRRGRRVDRVRLERRAAAGL